MMLPSSFDIMPIFEPLVDAVCAGEVKGNS